jgi:hypothetical protein
MRKRNPNPKAWMWWTAVVILVGGGGLGYLLSLDPTGSVHRTHLVWAVSGGLAGLLVISATSDWWFRR